MTTGLLLLLLATCAAIALAVRTYLRDEPPVRRRSLLVSLRVAALLLLVLLLWNPGLARTAVGVGPGWFVVDGTLGMSALDPDGESPWERALEHVRTGPLGSRVVLFDGEVRSLVEDALDEHEPARPGSELAEAVRRAVEAGAPEITVVSDFRIRDREALARIVAGASVPVEFVEVAGEPRNAGLFQFELPRRVSTDGTVDAEVELFGEGGEPGDSVEVEIREEERLVASRLFPVPERGHRVRATVQLPPPQREGWTRYEARVRLEGDGFPWDDVAVAYAEVDAEQHGIVLLSLRPDWEPRFLLPVLRTTTGLEGRGFLALADGRFLPLAAGAEPRAPVDAEEVAEALAEAEVLVLHGLEGEAPEWAAGAVSAAPRLLLLPRDPAAAGVGGFSTGPPREGEWFPDAEIPASPVAPYLGERIPRAERLPPLQEILPLEEEPAVAVPLQVRRDRRGEPLPLLVLREEGGRRVAAALGSGFWRWAMRTDEHRRTYQRLWAGVGAWLVGGDRYAGLDVRPEELVLPGGSAVPWRAAGREGEELRVRTRPHGTDEEWPADTVVRVGADGRFETSAAPAGTHEFRVETASEGGELLGSGRFDVLQGSLELSIAPWDPGTAVLADEAGEADAGRWSEAGQPLRTHPAPWILLLALLCTEWIVRRRNGLR